jgi:DMSO reductase anchor subunit
MAASASPAVLIPARRQTLWGIPAVINFACGGLGAGVYLVAAVAATCLPSISLRPASWLGPALVLTGFIAVATEAGRPLRGPRVLTRVATSWMSRELWLGGAFVVLAAGELVFPGTGQRLLAATAAAGLALAQGFILRDARGVAAWSVPIMPVLFLASAALSGIGLLLFIEAIGSVPSGPALLDTALGLTVTGLVLWLCYATWPGGAAFLEATRSLREGSGAIEVVGIGYVLPCTLAGLALAVPEAARLAGGLAGALLVAGQVRAKALLLLDAGQLRAIGVPHLRLDRRSS